MMVWHYVGTTKLVICHKCITMGSDQLLLGVSTRTGVQAMLDVDRVSVCFYFHIHLACAYRLATLAPSSQTPTAITRLTMC